MECIHIRSLEKYHPGYKDRDLRWAKIHFNMVQGDPDCELIDNEIDWGRLIKIILLELQAKKPLPNDDRYWSKKGFNIKKRPMALTIKMLHNFLDVVTQDEKLCGLDKSRVEESREDKKESVFFDFDSIWSKYPNKDGKKPAERHFLTTVKTDEDFTNINKALNNYLKHLESNDWKKPKNGSTWFNNWQDWINWVEPEIKKEKPSKPKVKYWKEPEYMSQK